MAKSKRFTEINFAETDFSRVAVIGCPGSGKTTLSCTLGQLLGLPVTHLDKVLWDKNWQMLPYEKREEIHGEIIARDSWLIDGMWRSHLAQRFQRATLVIFLDYRRSVSFTRAVRRFFKYRNTQRADIASGCLEKLDGYFLKYIWTFRRRVRPEILQLRAQHPDVQIISLSNPRQTQQFVERLTEYVKKVN